jgi:hypothetical protein
VLVAGTKVFGKWVVSKISSFVMEVCLELQKELLASYKFLAVLYRI